MANSRTPKDNQEKNFQDKMRKRLTGLFSGGEEPPTYMSISQVDALKAHVAELEEKLAQQGPVASPNKSIRDQGKGTESLPVNRVVPVKVEERQNRIGLWVAGIYAAISLTLLVFSFYMVYVVGTGHPDLSDKSLEPVAGLMLIASLISFYLIKRNRLDMAAWILLLVAIIPPIPAVLVLNDVFIAMVLYIAILATIPIVWLIPKAARGQAINATGVSALVVIAIQVWNPAFRLGSSTLPGFTTAIVVLAGLAILGYFIRQALQGSIRTKLLIGFLSVLILSSLVGVFSVQQQYTAAEQASITEASHVASTISEIVTRSRVELQSLVTQLHVSQNRDVKVVGPNLQIMADAIPADVGTTFDADQNGEVAATLKDGQQRTFVEISADYPQGIKQVVVPVRDVSGKIIAATVLDYTKTLNQILLLDANKFTNEVSATIADDPADLQKFISTLYTVQNRDMTVVDTQKQILADAVSGDVGSTFTLDLRGEVAATMKDGQPRTFIENSIQHPNGVELVVTALRNPGGNIIGATILGPGTDSGVTAVAQAYNVAEAISVAASQNQERLQTTIDQFHTSEKRDVSVVYPNLQIVADAVPDEIGTTFKGDQNGEVAATLKDGQLRTFVEITADNPQGIKQVVVPVQDESGKIVAATIMDYTPLYTELQQTANKAVQTLAYLSLAVLVVALVIGQITSSVIARPIMQLRDAALKIGKGQLDTPIPTVSSKDEIGILASTFRNMVAQLRELIGSLEVRVAERTHDLELASEVGRAVSSKSADIFGLLKDAVELILERFNLYYAQIYLVDPAGRTLNLRAGTGSVGAELLKRGHHLAVGGGSLNGRAVSEKRAVIVTDTMNNPSFLPNPLLPNTRSEMAIPLIAGDKVVGVLDMQSEQPGALSETNLTAFEALAGQLAIALQNATLFAQSEEARSRVEELVRRTAEEGWQDYLNATERGHKLGFGFDQTQVTALKDETLKDLPAANSLSVPIEVTGAKVGTIQVANELDRTWTPRETGILHAASEQLAQHIENLRLLAQAEKYRAEAEQAVRRLTREGWDTYLKPDSKETTGFEYDLMEVSPLNEDVSDNETSVIHRPLKVRDEVIGELSVNEGNLSRDDANELVSAVATELSSHIENLRLSISNMSLLKSTEDRAQREQTLRQITVALRSSTNPATIMRTAVRELGSILGRKTIVQLSNLERPNQAEPATSSENKPDSSANQS